MDDREVVSAVRAALAEKVGQERFDLWFGASAADWSCAIRRCWSTSQPLLPRLGPARISAARSKRPVPKHWENRSRWNFRSMRLWQSYGEAGANGKRTNCIAKIRNRWETGRGDKIVPADSAAPNRQTSTAVSLNCRRGDTDCYAVEDSSADVLDVPTEPSAKTGFVRRRFATLDEFAVGSSNRVAHASAQMVAEQPGRFSPLHVYGPTGVGKTHLLEGIWNAARKARAGDSCPVSFRRAVHDYFLEALHGSGLPSFRRKYRGVELLLVDGLQFFAGKRATLVELLHTTDTLLREGKQVVFAADRPPSALAT